MNCGMFKALKIYLTILKQKDYFIRKVAFTFTIDQHKNI